MISFLRGRVHDKQPNTVTVDVGGVGYEVHVPLSTFYNLGEEGAEVSLRVYTHVREDALQLYGFLTELERQLFERLIAISGIGPKLAIVVLSGWRRGICVRRSARRRRTTHDDPLASARRPLNASSSSSRIG
jgi:Holliday junction DNA helicase RuvA